MKITVRVPATTANLGPGFDCMGLALDWWNTITVEIAHRALQVRLRGVTDDLPADSSNLTVRTMALLFQRAGVTFPALRITMTNRIPMRRGLGSSAAAIIGGLVAANAWMGVPFSQDDLLAVASGIEGHPDNVSAALFGGLTIAIADGERLCATRVPPPAAWRAVLFVPEQVLETRFARQVLPLQISRADAVYNIGRAAMLTYAFMANDPGCLLVGTQDRLHQPYREPLVAGMRPLLEAACEAGASGVALSGAGPSVIAFTAAAREAREVAKAFKRCASRFKLKGTARVVRLSESGAQTHIL